TGPDGPARLTFGYDDWKDYIVEVTLQIEEGRLHMLVRGADNAGARDWQRGASFRDYDLPKGEMTKVRLECRGDTCRYTVFGSRPESDTNPLKYLTGPAQLLLEPDGRVRIKEIWVKVLSSEKGADSGEGG